MPLKIGYHNLIVDVATGIGTLATITVYAAGTTTASTIYSDSAGTAKDNPLTTDSVGRFSFFADPGEYDIKVSGTGFTTYTLSGVSIIGEADRYVKSDPTSGEFHVKKIRLDAAKKVLVTYGETAEP
jgi:hypothetical protein